MKRRKPTANKKPDPADLSLFDLNLAYGYGFLSYIADDDMPADERARRWHLTRAGFKDQYRNGARDAAGVDFA